MKYIFFFVHRYNDIDHLSPVIFFLSKSNPALKIIVISLFPSKGYEFDEKISFLLKKKYITFFNFTQIIPNNFFYKILSFFSGIGTESHSVRKDLRNIFRKKNFFKNIFRVSSNIFAKILLKFNLYNLLIRSFYQIDWSKKLFKLYNPSLIVIDHAISSGPQQTIQPIKSILFLAKKNNIKILSLPHGVPLFIKHPPRYDLVKKSLCSDISDSLVFQHNNWLDECKEFGLDEKKVKVFGVPRFFDEWQNILLSISIHEPWLDQMGKNKIKVVFMDTGPNNYGTEIKKVIDTVSYLSNNDDVFLIYKPHTRNQKLNLPKIKNIKYLPNLNSTSLINWADVVIGSSSSIMIECLYQKKLYISPSYFRKNRMIFEEYKACLEIQTFEKFKEFFKNINQISLYPYKHYLEEDVVKFYNNIVYDGKSQELAIRELVEHIKNLG